MSSGSASVGQSIADQQQLIDADDRYYQMLKENNYISDLSTADSATSTLNRNKVSVGSAGRRGLVTWGRGCGAGLVRAVLPARRNTPAHRTHHRKKSA